MLNEDELMELIDQIRFNLPDEIKQANWTVSEHEILRRSERHAAQVVKDAQGKSDQIIREAEAYALEQLKQLEAHLGRTLATVRRGVEALQSSTPATEHPDEAVKT